jgi:hypothetical protein
VGHLPLVYIQERAGGPQLVGRDHEMAASGSIRIGYIYTIRIMVSSINLDAKYISIRFAPFETDRTPETCIECFAKDAETLSAISERVGYPQIT